MKNNKILFHLKNNPSGKAKIKELMGSEDALKWLTVQLKGPLFSEEKQAWKSLLLDWEEELLLLASSSQVHLRYQSLSILVYSGSSIANRLIWDSLDDSDAGIRVLIVNRFCPDDRQKFYNRIYRIYLRDANYGVRKAARERIRKDFSDLFTINPDNLERREKIHCIELLDRNSSMDHDLALHFLQEKDLSTALAASLYLEKEGCLDKTIKDASLSDMEDLYRRKGLLQAAIRCQISSFLDKNENFKSSGSLVLAVELMADGAVSKIGESIIDLLMKSSDTNPLLKKKRKTAVECLLTIKTTGSYELLRQILRDWKEDKEILNTILGNIPEHGAVDLYPILLEFLKDPSFICEKSLIDSFQRFPKSYSIRDMYDLIRNNAIDSRVKKRALSILCHFGEKSTVQFILENLPVFNREELIEIGCSTVHWSRETFLETAAYLFKECDGNVRQSLIRLVALSQIQDFLPEIQESLTDSDPDSRITSVWALVDLDHTESLERLQNLLYDPIEQVRAETSRALIQWNKEDSFRILEGILNDPNEVDTVMLSIIDALGKSENSISINLLVPILEVKPEWEDVLIQALMNKKSNDEVNILVHFFKDGTPVCRSSLIKLFSRGKEIFENSLLDLLRSDKYRILHKPVSEILEETGYVDICIKQLKHRKQRIRKDAAEDLILIGTVKAWHGLIYAVKDISREIRILSIKAMEKLRNDDSEKILEGLKNDPDKKVRKYTLWALEKINAGKLP